MRRFPLRILLPTSICLGVVKIQILAKKPTRRLTASKHNRDSVQRLDLETRDPKQKKKKRQGS